MKSFREQNNPQESIQEAASRMSEMSPDQLTATLFAEVAKAKAQGSLKEGDLQNFCDSVAPMLNAEQNAKLRELVKQLEGK